ncbi:uncharacterized protein LOC143933585 isoform X2 [Lithobates pipiens]
MASLFQILGVFSALVVSGFYLKKSYKRICVSQDMCNVRGSASFPHYVRMKMGISCCTTDHCTPTFPTLPKDSSGYNGVMCPACISIDSYHCDCSEMMECMGDENMCLRMTTKVSVSRDSSNELMCPPSMPTDSKQCDPSDPIDCMGDENLFRNSKVSEQIVTLSTICGCATRSVCNFGRLSMCDEGITTYADFSCTSGSTAP